MTIEGSRWLDINFSMSEPTPRRFVKIWAPLPQKYSVLSEYSHYSCHHIKISVKLSRELSHGESQCWCHYVVKDGHVYRQVRLNMFWDSVLAWLARRS